MFGFGYTGIIASMKKLPSGGGALWTNLIHYYTSDSVSTDSVGTANLTLYNGTTYATGKINNGFSFDGVNDYCMTSSGILPSASDMTISFWCNITNNSGYKGLIMSKNYYTTGFNGGFGIRNLNGQLSITLSNGTSFLENNIAGVVFPNNTWKFVTVTFNNTTKRVNCYIDSTLQTSNFDYTGYSNSDFSNGVRLGVAIPDNLYLNGLIDELAMFDTVLTQPQITELYNSGNGIQYI